MLILFQISCQKTARRNENETQKTAIMLCNSSNTTTTASLKKLSPPQIREGFGNSHLSISTHSQEAQKWFDYGINLLHDFNHLEAYRVFNQVIKIDPTCAMGYWGIAMCQPGFGGENKSEWIDAISKGQALNQNATQLEKDLLDATEELTQHGNQSASKTFKALMDKYPDNAEVLAFGAIILKQNIQTEKESDDLKILLENSIHKFPKHTGLMHYYLHLMELRNDFYKVAPLFEKIAKSAPNASHITHMPGHFYYLRGEYQKAIQVFEKSYLQDKIYHAKENISYSVNQNLLHNLHFMVLAYSELNQKAKALEIAKIYANVKLQEAEPNNGTALMILYEGRILPALVHLRFREFKQADEQLSFLLDRLDTPIQNEFVKTYLRAMKSYAQGMQAVENKDIELSKTYFQELSSAMIKYENMAESKMNTLEFKNINETYDIMNIAQLELAGWLSNLDPKSGFDKSFWEQALDLERAIKYDEPPRLMYPINESLGLLHLRRKESKLAKDSFNEALKKRPNSKVITILKGQCSI